MITLRKSEDRGHARRGWLESYHTFSFANYHDPQHVGFRDLLVINEDFVQPGQGFGTHGHKDMEIITYILDGELEHKDSMGTGSVIRTGDVQRMSAGRGVKHSEFNHSHSNLVHLLQIWIAPSSAGITPSYEEKKFSADEKQNKLRLIVSPNGEDGSLSMNQNAKLYSTLLDEGVSVDYSFQVGRYGWIQVARGSIEVNGQLLKTGDAAAISDLQKIVLKALSPSEVLVFDLP